jgi:hypothetical protein
MIFPVSLAVIAAVRTGCSVRITCAAVSFAAMRFAAMRFAPCASPAVP